MRRYLRFATTRTRRPLFSVELHLFFRPLLPTKETHLMLALEGDDFTSRLITNRTFKYHLNSYFCSYILGPTTSFHIGKLDTPKHRRLSASTFDCITSKDTFLCRKFSRTSTHKFQKERLKGMRHMRVNRGVHTTNSVSEVFCAAISA